MFVLVSVNTIEEDIQQRANQKRKVDQMVIQEGKFNQKSTAEERRMGLESIKEILKARMGSLEEGTALPHSARPASAHADSRPARAISQAHCTHVSHACGHLAMRFYAAC